MRNPAADGRPRYVTDINAQTGVVTVGPRENLAITTIHADRLKFLHPAMEGELECEVQVRAHGSVVPCRARIDKDNDRMELSLHTPLQGVAILCWVPARSVGRPTHDRQLLRTG